MSSVAGHNDSKINQLVNRLPEGLIVDAAWMERHGYSRSLRSHYVAAGWLNQPTHRVYRRGQGPLSWELVVVSLQNLLQLPLVVGGRTALQLQGVTHYLAEEMREVHLYGTAPLPTWMDGLPIGVTFRHHNSERLFAGSPPCHGLGDDGFNPQVAGGSDAASALGYRQMAWGAWNWSITLSTPERAILELLDELPNRETFDHVDKLMEGLPNLSPRRLAVLLADCRSVKVKRLFFYFADRHRHSWRPYLDAKDFDLGSGNRVVAKGGVLDARYRITVPGDLDAGT